MYKLSNPNIELYAVKSRIVVSIPIKKCELKEGSPSPKVIVRAHSKRFLLLIASKGFLQFS